MAQKLAYYKNIELHCRDLAWSRADLLLHAGNPCHERSVKRLEDGLPIRYTSVNKIFNAIQKAHKGDLSFDAEIEVIFK